MKIKSTYIKAFIFLLIITTAIVVVHKFNLLSKEHIRLFQHKSMRFIESYGEFAPFFYVLLFTLRTLLIVFPYSVVIIVGGKLFGPVLGFVYSMVGIYLSASLAFGISRFLDKDLVERLLKGRIKNLDLKTEKHGFKIVLLMRLSMVFPFDLLSYGAGVTKIKYKDFILATMLGIIPETFSLTYLGDNLHNPFSIQFIIAVVLVLITAAAPIIINKYKRKVKNNT